MKRSFLLFAFLIFASAINISSHAATIVPSSSSSAIVPSGEPDPAAVKAAVEEFKSLSKKERKARIKELRKELKAFKKEKKAGREPSDNTVLLCILAVLLPPLAVYLHEGEVNNRFWISLLLTLLFWLPGIIYALVIILGDDD
jgi:uncharacterized membrane protein YqaE (UPF0057 family)